MTKHDPARGWDFAQKLAAEAELDRIERLSDAEVAAELRAKGHDPANLPSVEQLLGETRPARSAVAPAARKPRRVLVASLAAAALGAGATVVAVLSESSGVVTSSNTDESGVTDASADAAAHDGGADDARPGLHPR